MLLVFVFGEPGLLDELGEYLCEQGQSLGPGCVRVAELGYLLLDLFSECWNCLYLILLFLETIIPQPAPIVPILALIGQNK